MIGILELILLISATASDPDIPVSKWWSRIIKLPISAFFFKALIKTVAE